MMKAMMQRKAVQQTMNQESEHWSLQHVQLTCREDHGWLQCAAIKIIVDNCCKLFVLCNY